MFKRSICFILLLFASCVAYSQTSNGVIAGTVTDVTGASIAKATIIVTDTQTNAVRTATSNSVGGYRIESISPGTYTVEIKAPGFASSLSKNVLVAASAVASVNAKLTAGSTDTVDVEAVTSEIQTDSGAISETLTSVATENLPISGLNPYSLALTLPGVQEAGIEAMSNGVNFSVNGERSRANNFLIEGSDNNDAGIHGQGLQPGNLDAIDQITFLTNSYSAEFGGGGGSVSNLIYKTGSNHFHGAVWDRLLNSSFDAADKSNFYTGATKSKYRENIFGFDFGGFILRNKLFFFTSLQLDHYRSSTNSTLIIPTASGVATLQSLPSNVRITNYLTAIGNARGLDDPNNVNFSCLSLGPFSSASATVCPVGNVAVGPYTRVLPVDSNSPEFDSKGQWNISDKDTLVLRYIRTHYDAPVDSFNYPYQLAGFDTTQFGTSHNAGITETHIFNSHLLNELRLSYGRIGFTFDLAPSTYANPLGTAPTIGIGGVEGYGAPGGDPQGRFHNTYQAQDAVTWNPTSKHTVKVGFDIEDVRVRDAVPYNLYGSINYASSQGYSGLANYIDNYSGYEGTIGIDYGYPVVRPRMLDQNYYAQDTWKARQDLTLELGFRYEYSGTPFNSVAYPAFDINNPACTNPTVGSGGVPQFCVVKQKPDYEDFGPRFGFAWTPSFLTARTTVLRGGFGIFYDGLFTNILDNTQATAPNTASNLAESTASSASRGVANFSSYLAVLPKTASLQGLVESMVPNIASPRILQWNLNVEQQLPGHFLAQIGYVGTRGEYLYSTTESNPVVDPLVTGNRLFANRGRILLRDNSGDSAYHSAQVEVTRQFSHGFYFRGAYTWSRYMDDTDEVFTSGNSSQYGERQYPFPRKAVDWGLSSLDVRNRLVLSYVYQPPTWHAEGFARVPAAIVNHWMISGITVFQSGQPGNVEVGYDYNGDGISNDRPVLSNSAAPLQSYAFDETNIGGPQGVYVDGPQLWYNGRVVIVDPNSVHWLVPAYGSNPTTIHRNDFLTPGNSDWDFTIQRSFRIHDTQHFDFRLETFNIFNHGNTGIPNMTLTSIDPDPSVYGPNTFGDPAPTVTGHRNMRFYLKYSF